jgi:hypothetical protein
MLHHQSTFSLFEVQVKLAVLYDAPMVEGFDELKGSL